MSRGADANKSTHCKRLPLVERMESYYRAPLHDPDELSSAPSATEATALAPHVAGAPLMDARAVSVLVSRGATTSRGWSSGMMECGDNEAVCASQITYCFALCLSATRSRARRREAGAVWARLDGVPRCRRDGRILS